MTTTIAFSFVDYELDLWIILIGSLCAAACALPGALLVLRKQSMMGDAISHTVLPGLAIAFLITHSRDPLPMFIGAVVVGIITAFAVQFIQNLGRLDGGASMGVVFTTLFALGLLLIRAAADHVDLDAGCVLYGDVLSAGFDASGYRFDGALPRPILINGGLLVLNAVLIVLFYKEFKVSAFDPALADSLGISSTFMHYLLMTITAITTVAAFETVGSIIVIAMLIVPAATAYLLTHRFGTMLLLSVVLAVVAAAAGHVGALTLPKLVGYEETVTSGMMAVAAGVLFVIAWVASPSQGLVVRRFRRLSITLRTLREDVLGLLYRFEESEVDNPVGHLRPALGVSPFAMRYLLRSLGRERMIERAAGQVTLTDAGRTRAQQIVRTHRLWETYLAANIDTPVGHVHDSAERLEHVTTEQMQQRLGDELADPTHDPHGKPVPPGDHYTI